MCSSLKVLACLDNIKRIFNKSMSEIVKSTAVNLWYSYYDLNLHFNCLKYTRLISSIVSILNLYENDFSKFNALNKHIKAAANYKFIALKKLFRKKQ